ncbi:cellulose binding domain-containing protein [Acrocarpospora phusangensis]|nr:cellulose binding domain-containing protein [Acrocarpospora phusangensis]
MCTGVLTALAQSPASAAVACDVTYTSTEWTSSPGRGGFNAAITIKNTGDPISSWSLTFAFPAGQQLTHGWQATWVQSGTGVTATSLPWNGSLATGASTGIGFNGTWTGSNPKPTVFRVNGVTCGGTPSPSPSPSLTPDGFVSVTPTALMVAESTSATAAVRLSLRPNSNVTVAVTKRSGGDADLTAAPATLTFTPANWNIAQNVTISAAQDPDIANGTAAWTLSATGGGVFYFSAGLNVTEIDDESS